MFNPEAELDELISHFSRQLAPADRVAFRRAAENMLAGAPESWGPGSIYRALVPLWRGFFRPPTVERTPDRDHPERHRSRYLRLVG
jgi:hypothetical protein